MAARDLIKSYKEVRLQQLRSFVATAQLGSLSAAAKSLGLAQPTVWKQVHALEQEFGAQLVETHRRGCRLTTAGRLLVEMAAPAVASIDSLKRNFQEAHRHLQARLTIAASQRILVEDLPAPIVAFRRLHPHVQLRFLEVDLKAVSTAVESGEADLGITSQWGVDATNSWVDALLGYELDYILVTQKDHPLARKRSVSPDDLVGYPLVNSPSGLPDRAVAEKLSRLGVFDTPSKSVDAGYTSVIRRYVELGFGVGIVVGRHQATTAGNLHQRNMSRHFGRVAMMILRRRGVVHDPTDNFVAAMREHLPR